MKRATVALLIAVLAGGCVHGSSLEQVHAGMTREQVASLMGPAVVQPGKFAQWIAPPARGVNNQAADFEYVRFN